MKKVLLLSLSALAFCFAPSARAQVTYDSTNVTVNHGDPTSATFTYNSNLTQVQFRCVNGGNPSWFYYTRPNTSVPFTLSGGPFPISGGCQPSYSSDGDIAKDVLTEVVNAPLTGQANGQTVTVVFANFTSDKDGCCYTAIGGSSRITVQ